MRATFDVVRNRVHGASRQGGAPRIVSNVRAETETLTRFFFDAAIDFFEKCEVGVSLASAMHSKIASLRGFGLKRVQQQSHEQAPPNFVGSLTAVAKVIIACRI